MIGWKTSSTLHTGTPFPFKWNDNVLKALIRIRGISKTWEDLNSSTRDSTAILHITILKKTSLNCQHGGSLMYRKTVKKILLFLFMITFILTGISLYRQKIWYAFRYVIYLHPWRVLYRRRAGDATLIRTLMAGTSWLCRPWSFG